MFEPQGPISDVKAWQLTAAQVPVDPKPIHTTDQKLIGAVLCAIDQATGSQSIAGEITLNQDQVNHVAYLVALELEAVPQNGDRQQLGTDNASEEIGTEIAEEDARQTRARPNAETKCVFCGLFRNRQRQ